MKTYKFTARIESGGGGGAYALFPHDVEVEFGTKGRVPVKATFNGVSYTGTMIRYGHPLHMLPILKSIREQIGKQPGDMVDVEVRRDAAERVLDVPEDLENLLKNEKLSATFERVSYTNRREYCRWITDAKRAETRTKRLDKVPKMLRAGIKTPN